MIRKVSFGAAIFIYNCCIVVFTFMLYAFANFFRSTPISLATGGFFGCVVYFFIVISFISINRYFGREYNLNWMLIFFGAIVALFICFLIDRYCAFFCFLYCIPVMIYLVHESRVVRMKQD